MTTTELEPVVSEVDIEASPEIVFAFLVEPDKLSQWLCESATLDARAGGACHQVHRNGDKVFTMQGEFIDVVPYERVSFTWGYVEPEMMPRSGTTTVEITLTRTDAGTRLRLEHHGLSGSALNDHRNGWGELFGKRLPAAVARAQEQSAS